MVLMVCATVSNRLNALSSCYRLEAKPNCGWCRLLRRRSKSKQPSPRGQTQPTKSSHPGLGMSTPVETRSVCARSSLKLPWVEQKPCSVVGFLVADSAPGGESSDVFCAACFFAG
jgi:hypothetical protein